MTNARDKANIPSLNFSSTGIDDNATSTAITIDSSERVGISETDNSTYVLGKKLVLGELENNDGITLKSSTTTHTNYLAFADADSGLSSYRGFFGYNHNDNSFRLGTDSSERMRITSAGLVGIGTTTPSNYYSNKLVIDCGSASQDGLTIVSESTKDGMVSFADGTSGSNRYSGFILYDHADNEFRIATNGSEKMRITSAGLVGINNSSPTVGLEINGNIKINETGGASSGALVIDGTATANPQVQFKQNGTSKAFLTYWDGSDTLALTDGSASGLHFSPSTGNVGIGESAPIGKIHVKVSDSGVTSLNSAASGLFIESANSTGMTIASGTTNVGRLVFADSGNNLISYVQYDHSNNAMSFQTNGSEKMRIDSSGRLNLGTTTSISGSLLNIDGGFINANVTDSSHKFIRSTTATTGLGDPMICRVNTSADMADGFASVITFQVSDSGVSNSSLGFIGATRSGADNSGSLIFHTYNSGSQAEKLRIHPNGKQTFNHNSTASAHANFVGEVGSSSAALAFEHTNGGGVVGNVTTGSSGVNYNTFSDYRLKENIVEITDATLRLKQLQPKRFNFIADADTTVDGFIAHEVSSVVPEAITGTKDAVDADGNPEYQGIDQAKLVPLLVKTIQELEARITTLEANNP